MSERAGKLRNNVRDWSRLDHDGRVRDRTSIRVERITKTVWWPHPACRIGALPRLWRNITVAVSTMENP